jgi:hypothetical protein
MKVMAERLTRCGLLLVVGGALTMVAVGRGSPPVTAEPTVRALGAHFSLREHRVLSDASALRPDLSVLGSASRRTTPVVRAARYATRPTPSPRRATNSVTFADSTGEDPQAPDITTVVVSNDDNGLLTWRINTPNRPALTGDMLFLLFLDTDANATTGDPTSLGADYVIELDGPLGGAAGIGLFRWNGTDFTSQGVPQSSLVFSYANGATIKINASTLGAPKRCNFGVFAVSGVVLGPDGQPNFTNVHNDLAPDSGHGYYTYDVEITPQSTPPPPASPAARTYRDAPTLPSALRYTGMSIKHVRLGERLYQTMKELGSPRVVTVACWSTRDWPFVVASVGDEPSNGETLIAGFWLTYQPRWLHIAPKQCSDIQGLMSDRVPNGQRAYALTTTLHERVHADGFRNEAQTNCYAVQLVYTFARNLGFTQSKALYLEALAVRKTRATAPPGYWNRVLCRDGGKWDLEAQYRNLNY